MLLGISSQAMNTSGKGLGNLLLLIGVHFGRIIDESRANSFIKLKLERINDQNMDKNQMPI